MGADYVGLRGCTLQRSLGDQGFLGKLKLRAYKAAIEAQVPAEQRHVVKIQVQITGRETRELDYAGICRDLETFQAGSPECASCPLSAGKPVGCYRYVTYPIDPIGEEMVFAYYVKDLDVRDSIQDQLYRDIVSRIPTTSNWHTNRGPQGKLAALERPLVHTTPGGRHVDSAQVLQALFLPLDSLPMIVGYARLFGELAEFIGVHHERASRSRTLHELWSVGQLLHQLLPFALEQGGRVFVDA